MEDWLTAKGERIKSVDWAVECSAAEATGLQQQVAAGRHPVAAAAGYIWGDYRARKAANLTCDLAPKLYLRVDGRAVARRSLSVLASVAWTVLVNAKYGSL